MKISSRSGVSPAIFKQFCISMGLPSPVEEHRFDVPKPGMKARLWRMDYAWPDVRVALEVEGGVWTGGRHTRGSGFVGDMEKYNRAAALGWRVLRVQPRDLLRLATVQLIKEASAI